MTPAKNTEKKHPKKGEKKSNRPLVIGAVTVLVLAGAWIGYQVVSGRSLSNEPSVPKAYFTDDDGKTTFTDASNRICPFDHNGKQAVRAYCFTADGGKTHWVGYLERWNADVKRAYDLYNQRKPAEQDAFERSRIIAHAFEVKSPGAPESEWARSGTKKYEAIVTPKSPDGKGGKVEPYLP